MKWDPRDTLDWIGVFAVLVLVAYFVQKETQMSNTQRAILDWLVWLGLFLMIAGALLQCNCTGNFGQAQEEIDHYQIRESFQRHLGKVRYVDASALPNEYRINLGAALGVINAALKHYHNVEGRFRLYEGSVPEGGVLFRMAVRNDSYCDEAGTIEWVDVDADRFTGNFCVEKINTMFGLVGELLLKNEMARQLKAWDRPYVCMLAHTILHADLPEHIKRGGTQGLLWEHQTGDDNEFYPRQCQISEHEMKVWGKWVLPYVGGVK